MSKFSECDMTTFRQDFPILTQEINGKPLVYLDSGATSQKPQSVIDKITHYYSHDNANIHRGIYALSERATAVYEAARQSVKNFIHAKRNHEIVFTRGTTESINLIASSFGRSQIKAGDEILISAMEHHSNIVPWQIACEQTGALLKIIPVDDSGALDMDQYRALLNARTKIVSIIQVSNVLGTVNPVKEMIALAHEKDIPVFLDGAQAVPHMTVDVQDLDCDFYGFSAHKMYGPTGTGVLYGKSEWLEKLPPYQSGGDMISRVSFDETEYNVLPHKFEAGTPNMAGVVGLGAAIDYIDCIGIENIAMHEKALTQYATEALIQFQGLRIIGTTPNKTSVISFVMEQAHPHDIATVLDNEGIAIRAGHHCAMPLMERFNVPATARVSFGLYNQKQDVDRLIQGLEKVLKLFS